LRNQYAQGATTVENLVVFISTSSQGDVESWVFEKTSLAFANNLISIANNKQNFEKLPDTFWGYFARVMIAKKEICCDSYIF